MALEPPARHGRRQQLGGSEGVLFIEGGRCSEGGEELLEPLARRGSVARQQDQVLEVGLAILAQDDARAEHVALRHLFGAAPLRDDDRVLADQGAQCA